MTRSRIALIGNPNVGKTVIFNALTDSSQSVANFPGVTVEKKMGILRHHDKEIEIVDLPGIYSLTANSIDETIARQFIIEEKPDIVVDIIDSSNLDRNLYLTMQLLELKANVIVVLNMGDVADGKGISIDPIALSSQLGVPVITTIASRGNGIVKLKDAIIEHSNNSFSPKQVKWLNEYSSAIEKVEDTLKPFDLPDSLDSRWVASALLENDELLRNKLGDEGFDLNSVDDSIKSVKGSFHDGDVELAFINSRYSHIFKVSQAVSKKESKQGWTKTEMIDEVVTNKYLGIPIFLVVFWGVFHFVFSFGDPLIGLVELIFGKLGDFIIDDLGGDPDNFFIGMIVDGIIGGVGGILVFVPIIALLFIAIGILEDSGYLARVAFLMDKLMNRVGLNGQAIVPMLLGFGCNIPAIMATRTIKSEKERLTAIFVNGFMSCGARLPIYVLFAGAIFSKTTAANVTLLMYLIGILVAILVSLILRKTFFAGETSPFIIELPPYLRPNMKASIVKLWQRTKGFIYKAGTIILISTMIIYTLNFYGLIEPIGNFVSMLFWWMEIEWELGAALLFGLIAKEVVVAALGTLLGVEGGPDDPEDEGLRSAIKNSLESSSTHVEATTFSYMVFSLLYIPCFAALGAVRQETKSMKMTMLLTLMYVVVAYILAALTMVIGVLLF